MKLIGELMIPTLIVLASLAQGPDPVYWGPDPANSTLAHVEMMVPMFSGTAPSYIRYYPGDLPAWMNRPTVFFYPIYLNSAADYNRMASKPTPVGGRPPSPIR
jgi:hypothetical protein